MARGLANNVVRGWLLGATALLFLGGCNAILGLDQPYSEQDCLSPDGCADATSFEAGEATVTPEGGDAADGTVETGPGDGATKPDGDAGPGDGGPHSEAGCPTGSVACASGCVPNDTHNCGACGHDCTSLPNVNGQVACGTGGACEFDAGACASGYAHCGDGGPDQGCETQIDTTSNCGACGVACGASAPKCASAGGVYSCVSGCPSTAPTPCGSTCVDTSTDKNNCGGCGTACTTSVAHATPSCASSKCGYACNTGYSACGGTCVDLTSDPANCGACGTACPSGMLCSGSHCACPPGDISCPGGCAVPGPQNGCGGSTACTACPGPQTGIGQATCSGTSCSLSCSAPTGSQCGGGCVDTTSDSQNCGSCFAACIDGEKCSGSVCKCSSGNLGDNGNCGTCGNVCSHGEQCTNGACACQGGTFGDDNNCGTCGNVCTHGEHCAGGTCACASGTLDDNANCGTCGNACGSGTTCVNGSCQCTAQSCATGCCATSTGPCVANSDTTCGTAGGACNDCTRNLPTNAFAAACVNGACKITKCDIYMVYTAPPHGCGATGTAYYADCDGLYSTGCEAVAQTNQSCGGCNFQCDADAGLSCTNLTSFTRTQVAPCEDSSGNPTNAQCTGDFACGHSNGC